MTYEGYLNLGGNEVVNSARALGYARTGDCPANWLTDEFACDTLSAALGESAYDRGNISEATWYDPDIHALSSRFLGVGLISVSGLDDSTRQAVMTQKTFDGGQISGYRNSTPTIRVRAFLTGVGKDGLNYGLEWLRSVLAPNACGMHSISCGTSSLEYFIACPPKREDGETPAAYRQRVDLLRRYYHGVACTSGPLVQEEFTSSDGIHFGAIVEFSFEAEEAFSYSITREVNLGATEPYVYQDVAYNLVPYPSAELASGTIVMATNYATNPSVENDATGWGRNYSVITPAPTAARSTDIAAVGNASYKSTTTATNSGTNGNIQNRLDVDISAAPAGARFSVNMWSTGVLSAGTAVLGTITTRVQWMNSAGGSLRTDTVGTTPAAGGAVSASSILPPAGAVTARLYSTLTITSWSVGAVISLYSDAAAVTVP